MSITERDSEFGHAKNQKCFYCGEYLGLHAIHWSGETRIFLHPYCAVNLMIRLMRDVHEWQVKHEQHGRRNR